MPYKTKEQRKDQLKRWRDTPNGRLLWRQAQNRWRNTPKAKASRKAYKQREDVKLREALRAYGITPVEYQAILVKQHGGCAICGEKPNKERLHVDHCHSKGHVRGLLCRKCNIGIGLFKEDPHLMIKAISYVVEVA